MYCSNCGGKQASGSRFCSDCGKPLTTTQSESSGSLRLYEKEVLSSARSLNMAGLIVGLFIPILGWILAGISISKINKLEITTENSNILRRARGNAMLVFVAVSLVAVVWAIILAQ